MRKFFNNHKALAILGKTLLSAGAAIGISYLLNTSLFGGASADFVKSFTIGAVGAVGTFGLISEITYLAKGIKKSSDVRDARKKQKDAEDKVLTIVEDIELGKTTIKDPNNPTVNTTVTNLGRDINNLNVALNTNKAHGKSAGKNILNITTTNKVINALLTETVNTQALVNEGNRLEAKLNGKKAKTALDNEISTYLSTVNAKLNSQITDNKEIEKAIDNINKEAINLTK